MDLEDGNDFKPRQCWPRRGIAIRIIDNQVLDVEPPPMASACGLEPASLAGGDNKAGLGHSGSSGQVLLQCREARGAEAF